MKKILTTTIFATALMTAPAVAAQADNANSATKPAASQQQTQQSKATGTQANQQNAASASQTTGTGSAAATGMSSDQMAASQTRVRDVLTRAGLEDVQIMDAAYLVQARTPQNETVTLIVNSEGTPIGSTAANMAGQQNPTAN